MNVDLSTSGVLQEKIDSKRAQGQAGWSRSVADWPHFAPKYSGIFSKFPYKLLNSLLPLILKIWKENSEKGNPNLGITTPFGSHKPEDVIILAQENQGHPLP
jgi:hypothetical protein